MHELSIVMSLLEAAGEKARELHLEDVTAIHLRLGPLAGVVEDALYSAYELATEGTDWENCDLVVEETPLAGYCPSCKANRLIASITEICCVACGTPITEIVSGRELDIVALEVLDGVPNASG
jgi:hydrogenase nickel incorporation protein HypA/HybF